MKAKLAPVRGIKAHMRMDKMRWEVSWWSFSPFPDWLLQLLFLYVVLKITSANRVIICALLLSATDMRYLYEVCNLYIL